MKKVVKLVAIVALIVVVIVLLLIFSPSIQVEGRAAKGVYFSHIISQEEYCINVTIKNTGYFAITLSSVKAIFDAGGERLTCTTVPGTGSWKLMPDEIKSFEFSTDGYTYDLLTAATKNKVNILFRLILYSDDDKSLSDREYVAVLPPLKDLPLVYSGSGYQLEFHIER